jgi:hypothetical protein
MKEGEPKIEEELPHKTLDAEDPILEKGTLSENEGTNEFGQYKDVITGAISAVQKENFSNSSEQPKISGDIDGIQYEVRFPHLRKGKHAFVGIIDIKNPDGSTFSCVMRSGSDDAKSYLKYVSDEPAIADYLPKLYGIVDNFAVMEKLNGLELGEILERIKTDKEFAEKYADNAYAFIEKTANLRVEMHDVMFVDGQNCMVNPDTGEIKIIEQKNLVPKSIYKPNELIADKLFGEINQISRNMDNVDPSRINLVFQLLCKAFDGNKPEELYEKSRSVRPTHPAYKGAWYMRDYEKLSDEEHQKILNNPKMRDSTLTWLGNGYTKAFTPELIDAVSNNDIEAFKKLVKEGKYKMDIKDKNDPRYGDEIAPDDLTSNY